MANLMNLSQSAYQRIEHGESAWSEAQIIAAAKILDCQPREIMDDAPQMVQCYHDQATGYQAYSQQNSIAGIERLQQAYQESLLHITNTFLATIERLTKGGRENSSPSSPELE
jgi:hypothetical protein